MVDVSEKKFEATIEGSLLEQGYSQRSTQDYDQHRCLIPDDLFDFIIATQPSEWARYKDQHGDEAKTRLLRRLTKQINKKGTVEVLRNGIKATGCRFDLAIIGPDATPRIIENARTFDEH